MRAALAVLFVVACTGTSSGAPDPGPQGATGELHLPALGAPGPLHRVPQAQSIGDFMPATLDGADPFVVADADVAGWQIRDREVTVSLARITDVARTRASFELLGKDVHARMHGQELRGLRVQGNPAQLARDLDSPHEAVLTVVAANTYQVTVSVKPSADLDEPLHFAEQIDIGGMTRLALREAAPGEATAGQAPPGP